MNYHSLLEKTKKKRIEKRGKQIIYRLINTKNQKEERIEIGNLDKQQQESRQESQQSAQVPCQDIFQNCYSFLKVKLIGQFLYVHSMQDYVNEKGDDEDSSTNNQNNTSNNSSQVGQGQNQNRCCQSTIGDSCINSSHFPGTCLKNENIDQFSILYILYIIDASFNIFSIVILQLSRYLSIGKFFKRHYLKTLYNCIENSILYIIIYYADDKLMVISSLLLFVKNLLSIQFTLNYGRLIQFLFILSGGVVNAVLRQWSNYLVILFGLCIIQIYASLSSQLSHYDFINEDAEEEINAFNVEYRCSNQSNRRASGIGDNNFNQNYDDNQASHEKGKHLNKRDSSHSQRKSSAKKKYSQINPHQSITANLKGPFTEVSAAWDKSQKKQYQQQNQLIQLSYNPMNKLNQKEKTLNNDSMRYNLKKTSSLDKMLSPLQQTLRENQKLTYDDQNNQFNQLSINQRDQTNSFSSVYDRNSSKKRAQFMRYKTTSPGLKNDGTMSMDQSKSKNCQGVSSAGQIPSGPTNTILSGMSLPKSRQKIGKKPALNLSDIKGLKFNDKFKMSKYSSCLKIRSRGAGSLGSRMKIDLEEIGSQNGKKIFKSSQNIPLKSKNYPSDQDQLNSQLSPLHFMHEDIKNQFSSKNFQGSSNKLLVSGLNEISSSINNNHLHHHPISGSQINERQIKGQNFKVKPEIDSSQLQQLDKKLVSIESQQDTSIIKEKVNLKDFYGMFFQILSEGIVLFNLETGDININNTLKRLLNCHNEKECIEILFNLKNASLQPLNQNNSNTYDGMRSTINWNGQEEGGFGNNNNNNQEANQIYSSFMNINSYMYDNSLFTASKHKTGDDQTTFKLPTQKSQKSINMHTNQTFNNQYTNSNNINDEFSQIKRRHSTSSYNQTNTLMSKKTTRFLYKKEDEEDEDELNSSAEVDNSSINNQKIKVNSGIMSSNLVGFQFQIDAQNNSIVQLNEKTNIIKREADQYPLKTVKMNQKTPQPVQKQPDSGLYIEESLNQEQGMGSNLLERQQLQQQLQQFISQVDQIQESIGVIDDSDNKIKKRQQLLEELTRREIDKASKQGSASPKPSYQNENKQQFKPFQKIEFSIAKEFTVKDQFEKIEEEMQEYINESKYQMLGHHIKMLCKLDKKFQNKNQYDDSKTAVGTNQTPNGTATNINQQGMYYTSMSYNNQASGLNLFQHQNSLYMDGFKNRKTSRFSNLSALNPFQAQNTVQFIQQQIHQQQNSYSQQQSSFQQQQTSYQQQQAGNKKDDKKVIEITFIPCFVNQQKCLVLIVKDVSHFNSIKVLKDMNENRSKMLNYVVHEIRSPLNSIMNYLNSSLEQLSRDLYDSYIDPALQSAQMLNVLIQDLLDMAQMKAGKYKLNIRPFRIENLIEDVKRTMRVIVKQKSTDITLDSYIDPQITADISSDQLRIKQILINLISNAIKFTDEGSIRIEVNMIENRIYRFSVRDTGIGITEDQKKKLFSEFSKIETTQTDILNPKGVGLGLVISNTLAKSLAPKHMSAGLEILSGKQTKGSEFFFHILDFQQNGNNTQFNVTNTIQSDFNNVLTKTNKLTQTKYNNSILNSGSSFIQTQISPKTVPIKAQQYQAFPTQTQLINSLFPYTKESNQYDQPDAIIIDQDQLMLDQDINKLNSSTNNNNQNINNNNKNKEDNFSTPSSNSSSSPSSRRHSISTPIEGEEDVKNININTLSPKFKKRNIDIQLKLQEQKQSQFYQQQQQQQALQMRFLSSSGVGSEYKNIDNSGTMSQNNNNNNNLINNYSFIQNSFNRDPNKIGGNNSTNQSNPYQIQQQQQQQAAHSSYFNFEDNNNQLATPTLPFNSVQSLKIQFQSQQQNSQGSSSLQCEQLVNNASKQKRKCTCNNILIVDDDTFHINSLFQLIQSIIKQSSDKAFNSHGCEKLIMNKHTTNTCCPTYLLIFLDLNMFPSKDGFETLIEIQKYHLANKLKMPKVVACTGEADQEKINQCIVAGFNDILEKPIQLEQLKNILFSYLLQNNTNHNANNNNIPQQSHFSNTMSQLSLNQQFQPIGM